MLFILSTRIIAGSGNLKSLSLSHFYHRNKQTKCSKSILFTKLQPKRVGLIGHRIVEGHGGSHKILIIICASGFHIAFVLTIHLGNARLTYSKCRNVELSIFAFWIIWRLLLVKKIKETLMLITLCIAIVFQSWKTFPSILFFHIINTHTFCWMKFSLVSTQRSVNLFPSKW